MRRALLLATVLAATSVVRAAAAGEPKVAPASAAPTTGAPASTASPAPAGTAAGASTPDTDKATPTPAVVWPTLTPAGDGGGGPTHRPTEAESGLYVRAQELDATLRDAVQDLGLSLSLGETPSEHPRDADLVRFAATPEAGSDAPGRWVISPRLESAGADTFMLRIVAVPPGSSELRVRVATVKGADVAARGLVMLRDLIARHPSEVALAAVQANEPTGVTGPTASVPRSTGRALFAATGTVLGGFLAFSLQRVAVTDPNNADDPRVLYPLLLLGAGVGLGGALLASTEWDISTADALYFAGGAGWATAAGFFLSSASDVQPLNDRYLWGASGALIGATLATVSLTRGHIDDGGAALTHSGAAIGLATGTVIEEMVKGTVARPPPTGQGIGTAVGLVGAGLLARLVHVSASRVLLVDLGVGLGSLAGAAATSPLIFADSGPDNTRIFLGVTFGAGLAGGTLAYLLTHAASRSPLKKAWGFPGGGVIAVGPDGHTPAVGMTWTAPL